jgi:DNA-binding ferritin-like protein (Dps family)
MLIKTHKMSEIVRNYHSKQTRDEKPYWHHCENVSNILCEIIKENNEISGDNLDNLLSAAKAHDLYEDTEIDKNYIIEIFGSEVHELISFLTNDNGDDDRDKYIEQIRNAPEEAKLIKMADLLDNYLSISQSGVYAPGIYFIKYILHILDEMWVNIIEPSEFINYPKTASKLKELISFVRNRTIDTISYMDICERIEKEDLKNFAVEIVKNSILEENLKNNFISNINSVNEHQPRWHQWGIISHTIKFRDIFDKILPKVLKNWGLKEKIFEKLNIKIDGITKYDLLRISIPLHDLGKFDKKVKYDENGDFIEFDFEGHEKKSKEFILSENISSVLSKKYGLSIKQIEYISECAAKHYELGYIRNEAKKSSKGYNISFTDSISFENSIRENLNSFKGMEIEVGLLFFCDSQAKTEIFIENVKTDFDIENNKQKYQELIEEKSLNKKLINAAMQKPINSKVAENYLKFLFSSSLNN